MVRLVLLLVLIAALSVGATAALAHQSGCHSAHSCPSDHHSYVWSDGAGQGWSCASGSATEYDPSRDTTALTYDGYTYYCYAVGSAAPAPAPDGDYDGVPDASDACPTTYAKTANGCPSPPPDSDGDGVADASDACPGEFAQTTNGCPAPSPITTPVSAMPAPASRCNANGPLPDRSCSPGSVFHVRAAQVCKGGYSRGVRHVSESLKDQVYANYGVTSHRSGQYEIDHLIPLELGGSNSIKNLFAEPASPRPGFHEKDRLENRLHSLVCAGRLSLRSAQRQIARDWVRAYHRYLV